MNGTFNDIPIKNVFAMNDQTTQDYPPAIYGEGPPGAISAQPRSNDASNSPSVRISSNLMLRFFMTSL